MVRSLALISIAALICAGISGLWASYWAAADRKGAQDAKAFASLIDSPDRVGWRLSENSALLRVIIWDPDGNLQYPPQNGLAPLAYMFSDEDVRDLERRQSAAKAPGWGPFDVAGDQLLYCRVSPAICLIYDRRLLEETLNLNEGALESVASHAAWRAFLAMALLSGAAAIILWRRGKRQTPAFQLDPQRLCAKRGKLEVTLSPRDLKLLGLLVDRDGAVVTKDELYDAGWGRDYMPNSRALDQHITNLRRKLDPEKSLAPVFETVHGVGYRLAK